MSDLRYCSCLPQVRFLDTRDHAPGCAYTRIAELEAENQRARDEVTRLEGIIARWGEHTQMYEARIAELEAQELGWITTLSSMELEARKLRESNDSLRITVAKLEGLLFTSKGEQHEPG